MKNLALVHASRAAIEPVMRYYPKEAPELELTNLLDDGVMRLFNNGAMGKAKVRLAEMIATGRDLYGAHAALLTCSAVPRPVMEELRASAGIPVVKIDEPMARLAVQAGRRIGVIVTFPPTVASTRKLLEDAAADAGREIEILDRLVSDALQHLLAGDAARHDAMLSDAALYLAAEDVNVIVLAQVSMAHLVPVIRQRTGKPVFSSLETSLEEVRRVLA